MKKSVFLCFLFIIFISQYEYHDLSLYQSDTKQIEVKGEVEEEGIIEVDKDATTAEILQQAKVKESGDLASLNLTLNPENHSVIVVPNKQEVKKISINSGTLEELDTLDGIGKVVAQRIIDYRNTTGFQTLEELKNVKGIGDKIFERIKDEIVL